jgi:RHH-type proline utilization regulon transcriptional repressor/proline dehydrogenase/delta 1-pyrroline-5-carboxylate dehydrogenase
MPSFVERLERIRREKPDNETLATEAAEFAGELLKEAMADRKPGERLRARRLAAMMDDAAGKAFTFAMADQVFRAPTAARRARRFRDLVSAYGAPLYLATPSRIAMVVAGAAASIAPEIVMPRVAGELRRASASVILPSERERLAGHVARRRKNGFRLNFNELGEAVLGEREAQNRLEANLGRLADPGCDHISVKLSSVYSRIHAVGFDETLVELKQRLRRLYRAAMEHRRADGRTKFVTLDMEEYRDLRLTCATFREVLDEEEFRSLEAGIVLQAYLPDAWPVQKELNAWARERVGSGGARIKIRLVKGANLAMEKVEAELHGWPLAPYGGKLEVDANFKRMMHEGCRPENAAAVRLGVASHNLFDLAYGLLLRAREGVGERVDFEMLEGMANHQARVVRGIAGDVLLYAPLVKREHFPDAIAYLVRRLDENTTPGNFLHDLFGMKPGDEAWRCQRKRFLDACAAIETTPAGPRRTQNRATETPESLSLDAPFRNEPDTDFALSANVDWLRAKIEARKGAEPGRVPLQIGGEFVAGEGEAVAADPSRPERRAYRYGLAGAGEVERALAVAEKARKGWRARGIDGRAAILARAAGGGAASRGDAVATMVLDAGKVVPEADVEVSEAIDFANYYARGLRDPALFDGTEFEPFGTVVVTPPWNFPFAVPCGGVLAALAAGSTVILKPAPETVLTAWVMINALWDAGVPKEALQFLPCPDNEIGRSLVTDRRIDGVVLTGAHETARMFLSWKPEMNLFAETSGKNALIITAAADPDLAIKDLVRGAFGHAGQKCSAASLAIIEAEVYDDPNFRRKLKDAAQSLTVGPSWSYTTMVPPVIREPGEALGRALTRLDDGEEWLLEPRRSDDNPCLWSPGIKLGVTNESWYRRTECFGPVLGLVRAGNLDHAIRIQNDSEFGLTGGIHSLDPAEIEEWRERVEVGNAYINRAITGSIVRRQPFGGWKRSCFGPGAKAGGPNYVAQFGRWRDSGEPACRDAPGEPVKMLLERIGDESLRAAAESDAYWMSREFGVEHDPTGLRCETNTFRYRPIGRALLRADDPGQLARLALAARGAGLDFEISLSPGSGAPKWVADEIVWRETEEQLARRLGAGHYGVIRAVGCSGALRAAAVERGVRLGRAEPVANGRIELCPLFREQAISESLHRHGSVLPRRTMRTGPAGAQ